MPAGKNDVGSPPGFCDFGNGVGNWDATIDHRKLFFITRAGISSFLVALTVLVVLEEEAIWKVNKQEEGK